MALKSINTGSEPHQSLLIGHMGDHESRDTGNINMENSYKYNDWKKTTIN